MTCHRLDLGGGVTGFVCTETKWKACSSCRSSIKAEQGVLCDWPLTGPKAGKTCDRFVCRRCAKHVGEDRDYCPTHAAMGKEASPGAAGGVSSEGKAPVPFTRLVVRTARVSFGGPDRLDITRKSAGPAGLPFAPSWKILGPALEARKAAAAARLELRDDEVQRIDAAAWDTYVEAYRLEMRTSYVRERSAWDALLARESVVLCCYCTDREHCHRTLLAGMLVKLGATYAGEVS